MACVAWLGRHPAVSSFAKPLVKRDYIVGILRQSNLWLSDGNLRRCGSRGDRVAYVLAVVAEIGVLTSFNHRNPRVGYIFFHEVVLPRGVALFPAVSPGTL